MLLFNSNAATDQAHPNVYPLALQGRVPVKVSSMNGPIQPGDDLTSSTIPGIAMKATNGGQIIGKALEGYTNSDPSAVGQISVFVTLTYRPTPTTITDNGNLAAASQSGMLTTPTEANQELNTNLLQSVSDIGQTINLGVTQVQSLTTQSLTVVTDNIMIGGQTLKDYVTGLVEQLINQELNNRLAQNVPAPVTPVASSSADTTDQKPSPTTMPSTNASGSADIQIANSQLASASADSLYNSIASDSATASPSASPTPDATASASIPAINQQPNDKNAIGNVDVTNSINTDFMPAASLSSQLSHVDNLDAQYGSFDQGLIALGPTSLTDVGVSGTISVNNNLKVTADAINTVGSNLNIESVRQGNVLFEGGLIAIDTQGDLQVGGNATFAHNVQVNGELAAGIIAPIPNNDVIINLKNKSDKSGSSLIITNATGSGVLQINQSGDVTSSGEATFASIASHGFSIIRGAQADTSMTQTVAQGSAGQGTITAYETERTIVTPYVTDHSLIYITPTSNTSGVTPYLARQTIENSANGTKGSFTVAIPTSITKDISFNWWIVN